MIQQPLYHLLSSFFISSKGVMGMRTIQTELVEKGLKNAQINEVDKENSKTSKRVKESLTRREIEELMGCNRQTYKRVGGAVRNKR